MFSGRLQAMAIIGAALLLLTVLELVRRRRLLERYALLWLFSALAVLILSSWRNGLEQLAKLVGIYNPPNALFVVALFFILALLLHFSAAVSRLADQSKILAQRLALLEEAVRRQPPPGTDPLPLPVHDEADELEPVARR